MLWLRWVPGAAQRPASHPRVATEAWAGLCVVTGPLRGGQEPGNTHTCATKAGEVCRRSRASAGAATWSAVKSAVCVRSRSP